MRGKKYFQTYNCLYVPHIRLISNGMFASQSSPKMLLDLNKETIFIIILEKRHIRGEMHMGSLVSQTQIRYFRNNYSKRALKNYTKGFQPGFPHSSRTSCPNFKKSRRYTKKAVTDVCSHVPCMPYFKWSVPFLKRFKSVK